MAPGEIDSDFLPCGIVMLNENRKVVLSNRYSLVLMFCKSLNVIAGRSIDELVDLTEFFSHHDYV